jgi:hypothetical protein
MLAIPFWINECPSNRQHMNMSNLHMIFHEIWIYMCLKFCIWLWVYNLDFIWNLNIETYIIKFAFINCSHALVLLEILTFQFLTYFKTWKCALIKYHINSLLYWMCMWFDKDPQSFSLVMMYAKKKLKGYV